MKINFRKILGLLTFGAIFGLAGCLPEQDLADPIDPTGYGYALATFTTDFTGNTVNEGDTIKYTITLDKALDRALTFDIKVSEGTADETDYTYETVTIYPYEKEAEFEIIFFADDFPEVDETIKFEVGVFGLAEKNLLDAATVIPSLDLTIKNVNWEGGVTAGFLWENPEEDFDIFSIADVGGAWNAAATSNDPEIMALLWNEDDDDTYRLTVDPYSVEGVSSNYVIALGFPDQTVQFVEGTFDYTNRDTEYPLVYFSPWDMDTYELLNIEKSGTSLTIYTYDGTQVGTNTLPATVKNSVRVVDFKKPVK